MKKVILFVIFLFFIGFNLSYATDSWTIMVYQDGDNNLEPEALDDFMEMSKIGSNTNVNIIVQLDRVSGYSTDYDDWTDTKRFFITKGITPNSANAIMDLGEVNMADPKSLSDFFQWGVDNYPAKHYLLIIWDHGSGWYKTANIRNDNNSPFKAVCYDDTNGGALYYTDGDIDTAFKTMTQYLGKKIDIAGFDVCLNQMIENANYLYPYADYMVGSEDTEWGDGWSYWYFLDALTKNPSMSPSELASAIVDAYANGDDGNNNSDPSKTGNTLSALDLSYFPEIIYQLHDFAVLSSHYYYNGYASAFESAYNYVQTVALYNNDNMDLPIYINKLLENQLPNSLTSTATKLNNTLEKMTIKSYDSANPPDGDGIAIYAANSSYNHFYDQNKLAKETYWDSALQSIEPIQNYSISYSIQDFNNDGIIDKGETFTLNIVLKNESNFMANTINESIYTKNDFCNFNYQNIIIKHLYANDTYLYTISAVINPNYSGFGTEDFYISLTTPYWDYNKTFKISINIGSPIILFVDDDGGDTTENIIKNALNNDEYYYSTYDIKANGDTFPSTLLDNYKIVLWNTGNKEISKLFKNGEISLMEKYLNNGGNLLLSSKNLIREVSSLNSQTFSVFLKDYLHVDAYQSKYLQHKIPLEGIFGDPITENMNITLYDPIYSIELFQTTPTTNAIYIFKDNVDNTFGIRAPRYSKYLNYKSVFLPFPLENMDQKSLEAFIDKSFKWFFGLSKEIVFDLNKILAYPNPTHNKPVRFTETKDNTIIEIYAVDGTLIKVLPENQHSWDLTNKNGKKISSGIYFYVIKQNNKIIYSGKIAVII